MNRGKYLDGIEKNICMKKFDNWAELLQYLCKMPALALDACENLFYNVMKYAAV